MSKVGKLLDWVLNPVGALMQEVSPGTEVTRLLNPVDTIYHDHVNSNYQTIGDSVDSSIENGLDNLGDWLTTGKGGQAISKVWDDLTGKSQIDLQNRLNRENADYEYQRNLHSIGDTIAEYEKNGINRNLIASSGSAASYQAPQLQAYSGSARIDNILGRVGKVLGLIPAMYQATAALEGIDQARERTKQSEIKTMSMGMNLLDQGYKLGDTQLSHPFGFDLYGLMGDKRHWISRPPLSKGVKWLEAFPGNSANFLPSDVPSNYADSALKHKFDLLKSIGIKNELNSTLNSWRGYQYQLDRRYGNAGRIIGLASQSAGAVGKLFQPIKLF